MRPARVTTSPSSARGTAAGAWSAGSAGVGAGSASADPSSADRVTSQNGDYFCPTRHGMSFNAPEEVRTAVT